MTLQLRDRDVDLVIKDQSEMDMILLHLITQMRSMDGHNHSASYLLESISQQKYKETKPKNIRKMVKATEDEFF